MAQIALRDGEGGFLLTGEVRLEHAGQPVELGVRVDPLLGPTARAQSLDGIGARVQGIVQALVLGRHLPQHRHLLRRGHGLQRGP
ncbi:MAG: hypothetical protein V9G19_02085 [Tetrasphaera sp.]